MNNENTIAGAAAPVHDDYNDRPNPGIEKFRADLSASKYDPEIFGEDRPAGFINTRPEPTVEDAIAVRDQAVGDVREFTGLAGAAMGFDPASPATGDGANQTLSYDAEQQKAEHDAWRGRELRTESLRVAARNHQGRGIPVEMLIDEARICAAFIETGEVPDFSY